MGDNSAIEWTDATWNPTVGCSLISPGCTHCYAMIMAARLQAIGQAHYAGTTVRTKAGPVWNGIVLEAPRQILEAPLRWARPRRIFVNSMSDLFHEDVPDATIWRVFEVMRRCPQHIFQLLTKRHERMREFMNRRAPLANLWLGVSVEDDARALQRIPSLIDTPAAKRFLSCEPLLGGVLIPYASRLDWVICGGESGPRARPMHPHWARDLRDQCAEAGVPFFFKQWGEYRPLGPAHDEDDAHVDAINSADEDRTLILDTRGCIWNDGDGQPPCDAWMMERVGKKRAGAMLDGVQHKAFPK